MNRKLINLIDRAKNPRDRNFRNHLYIFLICCGISLFIWFLIKMSDEYISEIKIPVSYENEPIDKLLVNADDYVTVRLRAMGGNVFSEKFFSGHESVILNLKQADIRKSRYFDKYYILTDNLKDRISHRFDYDHDIMSIDPDTLFLEFEEIISKSVKIKTRINVSCKPQYQVYDSIIISPQEVIISGPSSVIDTIRNIYSISEDYTDLDKNLETMLALSLPLNDNKISYSETEVKLNVPVEKYTESSIELPVMGSSNDTAIRIRTFPESVQLTYQVAIKDYKLVKPDMFFISAYFDTEKDKEKKLIKVKVHKSPEFIKITRIHPDKVEFLIQK